MALKVNCIKLQHEPLIFIPETLPLAAGIMISIQTYFPMNLPLMVTCNGPSITSICLLISISPEN